MAAAASAPPAPPTHFSAAPRRQHRGGVIRLALIARQLHKTPLICLIAAMRSRDSAMKINFRLFASVLAFGVSFAAAAFAQSQPTPVGSRADAIVEKPLVTSETDLSGAKPQPMPSIAAPVN